MKMPLESKQPALFFYFASIQRPLVAEMCVQSSINEHFLWGLNDYVIFCLLDVFCLSVIWPIMWSCGVMSRSFKMPTEENKEHKAKNIQFWFNLDTLHSAITKEKGGI